MAAPGGPNSAAGTAKNFVFPLNFTFPLQTQENFVWLPKEQNVKRNTKTQWAQRLKRANQGQQRYLLLLDPLINPLGCRFMGFEEGDCAGFIWVQDVPIVISDNQVQTQDPGQPQETKKKKNARMWEQQRSNHCPGLPVLDIPLLAITSLTAGFLLSK